MDNAVINTAATHETRNEPQEGVPKPSASPVLGGSGLRGVRAGFRFSRGQGAGGLGAPEGHSELPS